MRAPAANSGAAELFVSVSNDSDMASSDDRVVFVDFPSYDEVFRHLWIGWFKH
jgi:hypothetical protein